MVCVCVCSEEIQCCFLQNGVLLGLCKYILTTTEVKLGGGVVVRTGGVIGLFSLVLVFKTVAKC